MRVLLIGDYPTAMFNLSDEPGIIINMIPQAIDPCQSIKIYLDLCLSDPYHKSISIYNDTPWTHLLLNLNDSPIVKQIKEKLYLTIGWKPDLVIYVYSNKVKNIDIEHLVQQLDIPMCSTNGEDNHLQKNLLDIINQNLT